MKEFLDKSTIVYLDDILIFSKTLEEHLLHIKLVFEKLREEKLLINLKKCNFMKRELVHLGFVISGEGLKMDLEKVRAILEWPTPRSAMEVRSFHGLASFYRKFIRGFSSICAPLIDTMRGDKREFRWTIGTTRSFNLLKSKVIEQLVLALLDFSKAFQVDCDASGNAIGVVLSQEGKPIGYFSEKLNGAKRKYSVYD